MNDTDAHESLYRIAESQTGYFTTAQAIECGLHRNTLVHHARKGGRFERVGRGLYRLRLFPTSPHEHVVLAWLAVGGGVAVASHESALELYELSDIIPGRVHITLPRASRYRRSPRGVQIHTTVRPLTGSEVRRWKGVRVTSPERSILDALETGSQPEQIEMAIAQALDRGLTTRGRLRETAGRRRANTRSLVEHSVERAPA